METKSRNASLRAVIRGALIACAASVILVIAFAFALQKQWLGMESINAVNTGIKVVSALTAAAIAARSVKSRTLLWGALAGGAYMLITFLVFSLLSGKFSLSLAVAADFAMCMLGGAIVGIIRNLRR
ncbi:MAG: TIGR04086 family membrane protein [Clostridia bacterium]|nr:TIGR04086 family membrane protein [Clostridia bacterium]